MFQLFRGREGVDLSGREDIWQFYINFIRENLFWGNGSFKLLEPVEGNHAHNSYLQLVSTNGLFLAFLFLSRRTKKNSFRQTIYRAFMAYLSIQTPATTFMDASWRRLP